VKKIIVFGFLFLGFGCEQKKTSPVFDKVYDKLEICFQDDSEKLGIRLNINQRGVRGNFFVILKKDTIKGNILAIQYPLVNLIEGTLVVKEKDREYISRVSIEENETGYIFNSLHPWLKIENLELDILECKEFKYLPVQ